MEAFATVDDYIARFGEVDDEDVLLECLMDATVAIKAALDPLRLDYSTITDEYKDRLMRVCRAVANRILPEDSEGVMQGVTQMSTTAGPYSQQFTFASSYGTPKLLPSELQLLGISGGSYIGSIRPKIVRGCYD